LLPSESVDSRTLFIMPKPIWRWHGLLFGILIGTEDYSFPSSSYDYLFLSILPDMPPLLLGRILDMARIPYPAISKYEPVIVPYQIHPAILHILFLFSRLSIPFFESVEAYYFA
ncbi:hypothetical protein KI387_019527, partial [Taxus chinensis]